MCIIFLPFLDIGFDVWLIFFLNLVQAFTGSLARHFIMTFPNSQDPFISPLKKWLQKKTQNPKL